MTLFLTIIWTSALKECTPSGCLAVTLLILMAFNGVFCLVAGILCVIEVRNETVRYSN